MISVFTILNKLSETGDIRTADNAQIEVAPDCGKVTIFVDKDTARGLLEGKLSWCFAVASMDRYLDVKQSLLADLDN